MRFRLLDPGGQGLLAHHVEAARHRALDQHAMRGRGGADVAEVEILALEQLLGRLVLARARQSRTGPLQVGEGHVGHAHDLHVLAKPLVARPLRNVAAQGDVAGADEGAA